MSSTGGGAGARGSAAPPPSGRAAAGATAAASGTAALGFGLNNLILLEAKFRVGQGEWITMCTSGCGPWWRRGVAATVVGRAALSDYSSNIVNVCVDFLCLDFGVQMVRGMSRAMSQQWVSIRYKQCIPKLESIYISNNCTVVGTSLLRCYQDCHGTAKACLSKLPAPAAR